MTVVLTLISIGFLIGGIVMVVKKSNYNKVSAVVSNVSCTPNVNDSGKYECIFTASYTVNGTTYTQTTSQDSNIPLKDGSTTDIYYNTNNPSEISIGSISPKKMGWLLIIVSIVMVLFTILMYYLTMKYQPIAAVEGVAGVLDILKR